MDTHLSNEVGGLEFVALAEITPAQLFEHYSRSRVVVEMAKGFNVLVSADQFSNKNLRWVGTQVGEA